MTLKPVLTSAASGLRASSLRATSAADNIVNALTPGYEASTVRQKTVYSGPAPGGSSAVDAQLIGTGLAPDLGQEITKLIEAKTVYRANAEVLNTASELSRETINALV